MPSPPAPTRFPIQLELAVQWGEMDAYRHVNNAVYFRWFETARMSYFAAIGWPEVEGELGIGPILHSTSARFLLPLVFPDRIRIRAGVGEIGDDRFTMHYEVESLGLGRLAARGSGVIVAYDYRRAAKALVPVRLRRAIEELEKGPVVESERFGAGKAKGEAASFLKGETGA